MKLPLKLAKDSEKSFQEIFILLRPSNDIKRTKKDKSQNGSFLSRHDHQNSQHHLSVSTFPHRKLFISKYFQQNVRNTKSCRDIFK
jgi:hypothetical protein